MSEKRLSKELLPLEGVERNPPFSKSSKVKGSFDDSVGPVIDNI
jgi:hypothetical protein